MVQPRPGDLSGALEQLAEAKIHPDAEPFRTQIKRFCAEHDNALYRTCLAGHLTGSAIVVDQGNGSILLLHHVKLDRWLQPGGHADGDGNLAAVALREATEETGIDGLRIVLPALDVDVHQIPERGLVREHLHLDLRFLMFAPPGADVVHNHESLGARWVSPSDPAIDAGELRRAVGHATEAMNRSQLR